MENNALFNWLNSNATQVIESVSTDSIYFVFDSLKIRMSDHFTNRDDHDLDLIFVSPKRYVIVPTHANYKKPTLCCTWNEGVDYVSNWLKFANFYLSRLEKMKTVVPKEEIKEEPKIVESASNDNSSLLSPITNDTYMQIANYKYIIDHLPNTWLPSKDQNLRKEIIASLRDVSKFFNDDGETVIKFVNNAKRVQGDCKKRSIWLTNIINTCNKLSDKTTQLNVLSGDMQ